MRCLMSNKTISHPDGFSTGFLEFAPKVLDLFLTLVKHGVMRRPRINHGEFLDQTLTDLESHIQERNRIDVEIAKLKGTARVLSEMLEENEEQARRWNAILGWASLNAPNLTDSIRAMLRGSGKQGATAIGTRDRLQDVGFDFSGFTNPLASVHTTLKRLFGKGELVYGNERDGKPVYVWALPEYGASASLANWMEDRQRDERIKTAEEAL